MEEISEKKERKGEIKERKDEMHERLVKKTAEIRGIYGRSYFSFPLGIIPYRS